MYFNHNASSFPKPEAVLKAIEKTLSQYPENENRGNSSHNTIQDCRQQLKSFFEADDAIYEAVFCSSSTEALNLCLLGLPATRQPKPTHIISTVIEHNAVLRPLNLLKQEGRAEFDLAPCDKNGFVPISAIQALIKKNTSAIVISHASNVTGAIQNIEAISNLAKKNNIILIVDAAQSAGAIPISLEKIPIDALIFTAHKSLWALAGTGGLILNRNLNLSPLKVGGTGSLSAKPFEELPIPQRYEAGTPNIVGIAALAAGLTFVKKIGFEYIFLQKKEILSFLLLKLDSHKNIELFAVEKQENKIPVINLNIRGLSPDDLSYILQESFGIHCRSGLHCSPLIHSYLGVSAKEGTVRLSFSHLNTMAEAQFLADAILQCASMTN
jgi:cysteine desulfurase family protein